MRTRMRRHRRKKRYTRRRSSQIGGKFIAAGSYGGVFGGEGGPLPCKGEEETDHTIITKLLLEEDADNEFRQKQYLEKVDPDQTFLLYPLAEPCDIKPFDKLEEEQKVWVTTYLNKADTTYSDEYKLVKYKYGGVELGNVEKKLPILTFLEKYLDLMKGVLKMHNNNMFHCDIKIANILIDHNNTIRLVDFGLMHVLIITQSMLWGPKYKWVEQPKGPHILDSDYDYWPFYAHYLFYSEETTDKHITDQLKKYYTKLNSYLYIYPILKRIYENDIFNIRNQLKYLMKFKNKNMRKIMILKGIDMFGLGFALVEALYKNYNGIPKPIEDVIINLMSQNLNGLHPLEHCINMFEGKINSLKFPHSHHPPRGLYTVI